MRNVLNFSGLSIVEDTNNDQKTEIALSDISDLGRAITQLTRIRETLEVAKAGSGIDLQAAEEVVHTLKTICNKTRIEIPDGLLVLEDVRWNRVQQKLYAARKLSASVETVRIRMVKVTVDLLELLGRFEEATPPAKNPLPKNVDVVMMTRVKDELQDLIPFLWTEKDGYTTMVGRVRVVETTANQILQNIGDVLEKVEPPVVVERGDFSNTAADVKVLIENAIGRILATIADYQQSCQKSSIPRAFGSVAQSTIKISYQGLAEYIISNSMKRREAKRRIIVHATKPIEGPVVTSRDIYSLVCNAGALVPWVMNSAEEFTHEGGLALRSFAFQSVKAAFMSRIAQIVQQGNLSPDDVELVSITLNMSNMVPKVMFRVQIPDGEAFREGEVFFYVMNGGDDFSSLVRRKAAVDKSLEPGVRIAIMTDAATRGA